MTSIKSFHDLEIWKLSHQLVLEVYKISKMFPKEENFRITSQLIRASYSIPSNIAEGMGRYTRKEFINFLTIARGSVEECKYLILLAKDLGYISEVIFTELTLKYDSLGKMINSLINSLKRKSA
ncbi:MAG: four helix bundle protein [Ignavibacteriales bacterium]|nr:four helix bundle protein [Ignavibacteriales bacterium]